MRFVSMMRELTPRMVARYTQVDYHRELAPGSAASWAAS
ncbi:acyl-CoA synthetase [Bordetella pertussis]|nr:acyl-CoA synthetase [Bordetella pertussis]